MAKDEATNEPMNEEQLDAAPATEQQAPAEAPAEEVSEAPAEEASEPANDPVLGADTPDDVLEAKDEAIGRAKQEALTNHAAEHAND